MTMARISRHQPLDSPLPRAFNSIAPKHRLRHDLSSVNTASAPASRDKTSSRLNHAEVLRIVRFGAVGAVGTLLNTLVVWMILSLGYNHFGWHPGDHTVVTAAAAFSWILCCGTNYLLNAFWTFHHWPPHWRQALHYYSTALLSFGVQILVLNLLVFLLDTARPLETAVLNGVAVATGALLNYLAASLWVFSPSRHPWRKLRR